MYQKELNALKHASRFRERSLYDASLLDFASNDYLGMAHNKIAFQKSYEILENNDCYAPKASMLVNGYTSFHRDFEESLCHANGFEGGILFGSGFLANMALVEALVRKKDVLYMDEEYHASGVMGTQNLQGSVVFFHHNDPEDLRDKIREYGGVRKIIAIEGVYSMQGDIAPLDIHTVARENGALLLVDEAHSNGTIGENLLGWFDYHGIEPDSECIKMGTLGKAYGSYGAYVLASHGIISYLENRAKPLIYSTALSLFDTVFAHENFKQIQLQSAYLLSEITNRRALVERELGKRPVTPILSIPLDDSDMALIEQERLKKEGYLVGAIRPPTVKKAMLRIILRTYNCLESTRNLLQLLRTDV